MATQRIIAKILCRYARNTCDDPDQQRFQVYRSRSHCAECDQHQLPEESEEQDKPHGSNLRQDDQIEIFCGLSIRHPYAQLPQFVLARIHRASGVVKADSEEWVLQVAVDCSLENVEAHIEGIRPRPKVNYQPWRA